MLTQIVHDTHSVNGGSSPGRVEIKIAYIGGGSREWAVKLMGDLALSASLGGTLALFDIDYEAAVHNRCLSQAVFSHRDARSRFHVTAEHTLEAALRGADFVVISIEPGPTPMRYADLEIPVKYGVLQTVGDTTGPGGILRALRCAPIYQKLAAAIMEHCPDAWVINYTNPMAACVRTLATVAPEMKVFGCCHEVFGTQKMLAALVDDWFERDATPREEIELDIAGVNHFTWATKIRWKEHDLVPRLLKMIEAVGFFRSREEESLAAKNKQSWFAHSGLVAYDLLRRFGALGAAGDRHLAEFVPWYLRSEKELHRWGVVLTPYSWRLERSQSPRPSPEQFASKIEPSGEEGVRQIEALVGVRPLTTNVNLPNRGQIADLPLGGIVETYAHFTQNAIRPVVSQPLPEGSLVWVRRAYAEQTLTVKAALDRDKDLAFQAMLSHPLVRLSTDEAWKMFKEMLAAAKTMLPGWKQ